MEVINAGHTQTKPPFSIRRLLSAFGLHEVILIFKVYILCFFSHIEMLLKLWIVKKLSLKWGCTISLCFRKTCARVVSYHAKSYTGRVLRTIYQIQAKRRKYFIWKPLAIILRGQEQWNLGGTIIHSLTLLTIQKAAWLVCSDLSFVCRFTVHGL